MLITVNITHGPNPAVNTFSDVSQNTFSYMTFDIDQPNCITGVAYMHFLCTIYEQQRWKYSAHFYSLHVWTTRVLLES